jgi:mevalonate kinase
MFKPFPLIRKELMERNQQQIANFAEIFVQGIARIVDIQTSATRVLLQTHGRSASFFGAPDWTRALNWQHERFAELFTAGTEQTMNFLRQTSETVNEVQAQVGRILEQRTAEVTDEIRNGVKEVTRRGEQSLEEMRNTTQQAIRQARRMHANGNSNGHGARRTNGGGTRRSRARRGA